MSDQGSGDFQKYLNQAVEVYMKGEKVPRRMIRNCLKAQSVRSAQELQAIETEDAQERLFGRMMKEIEDAAAEKVEKEDSSLPSRKRVKFDPREDVVQQQEMGQAPCEVALQHLGKPLTDGIMDCDGDSHDSDHIAEAYGRSQPQDLSPKNVTAPAMTMQPAISYEGSNRVLSGGLPIVKPPEWQIGQSPELLHEILKEHGVVVVPNVVSKEQADEFERQFKGVLSSCNPSWNTDKTCAPVPGSRGCSLLKWFGLAIAACTQRLRCDKGTLAAFAALYNCDVEDLVTSIDCVACSLVHMMKNKRGEGVFKSLLKSSLPPHQDETKDGESQNLKRKLEAIPGAFPGCVQSSLVLQAQEAKQIGNKWYAPPSFVAMLGEQPEIPDGNKDYAPPNMDPDEVIKRLCYIEAPSCSMILWTSNTVHTNYGGDAEFFQGKGDFDFARLAIMVCAVPRVCSSDDTTAKKKALFGIRDTSNPKLKLPKHGASTSHYPHVVKPCGPGHMSNKKEGDHRHWETHKGPLTEEQARHI